MHTSIQASEVHKGVFLLENVVPADVQEEICALLLQPTELYAIRWKDTPKEEAGDKISTVTEAVTSISSRIHQAVYGENGIWATLPEDGCSEDHQGRPFCNCQDKTPHYPRSTKLNCVEALAYRNGSRRDWHRDANWMVGLTFGNTVKMGFQRLDEDEPCEVDVKSGNAVIFNGGLHKHAVLGIVKDTAPEWWKYPFSRVVFLMRDSRQSYKAFRQKVKRQQAAIEGGKLAAKIALEKFGLGAKPEAEAENENDGIEEDSQVVDPWWVTEDIDNNNLA